MNQYSARFDSKNSLLSRDTFLIIVNTAIKTGALKFARQAVASWLTNFPGDLSVGLISAQILIAENRIAQALPKIEKILRVDPEFLNAHSIMAQISAGQFPSHHAKAISCCYALGKESSIEQKLPQWSSFVRSARIDIRKGDYKTARASIEQAFIDEPHTDLIAIAHLELNIADQNYPEAQRLAKVYRTRFPECVLFKLRLAELLMQSGEESEAVRLMHQCVTVDTVGQVANRLWGEKHAYQPLWPDSYEMLFDIPIPAEVSAILGWNLLPYNPTLEVTDVLVPSPADQDANQSFEQIPTPLTNDESIERQAYAGISFSESLNASDAAPATPQEQKNPKKIDSTENREDFLRGIQDEFDHLAKQLKKQTITKVDARYPVYVVLSTHTALEKKYGVEIKDKICQEIKPLVDVINQRPGWSAISFYPDTTDIFSIPKVASSECSDPWKLKLSLVDLDQELAKKGQMIGALLIVGGPDVIPFHKLPNPADDMDTDVPSDNPYGTLDSNYFIPEYPLGRISGDASVTPNMLIEQIRAIKEYHIRFNKNIAPSLPRNTIISDLLRRLQNLLRSIGINRNFSTFGLTAAVWKKASEAAYQPIGKGQALLSSPPEVSSSINPKKILASDLAYFNLHGMEDGAEWYGQREYSDPVPGPDYPIALSPKDLVRNTGQVPKVVFSEACYGGHISSKMKEQSMALRFLSLGVPTVVASSNISYGSVNLPLIGADLLALFFWRHLKQGETTGDALLQAKVELTKEMNKRQGFLDGEDQKTLISFILYGDPLAGSELFAASTKKALRRKELLSVKTISDTANSVPNAPGLAGETIKQVKQLVESYLPGLENAQIRVSHQKVVTEASEKVTSKVESHTGKVLITITKQVQIAQRSHARYARVTLDKKGKVVKLAVSR